MAKKVTEKKLSSTEKEVGEFVSRSEKFIENNKKIILYGVAAIAVIIGGFMLYNKITKEKNENAAIAMFRGEYYFLQDSFNLALNGNGADFDGFIHIIDQYGRTKSGNLAKAYAGICFYKTGDYASAIKYLNDFNFNDDIISPAMIGLIGDCYIETGDVAQGITFFEKAASKANNDLLSPYFLKKAGTAFESLQQYDKALNVYTSIKEKHAASTEARDIDKFIIRAQLLNK